MRILVVGGGILGSAISWRLVRAGAEVLQVFPADHGPDSATLAAAAMISPFGELTATHDDALSREKLAFRVASQDRWPEWLAELRQESETPIHTTRGIFMVANPVGGADRDNLDFICGWLNHYQRQWHPLEPDRVPGLAPLPDYASQASIFIHDDFTIDAAQLLEALHSAFRRRGGTQLDARVEHLRPDGGGWRAETTSGSLLADQVVVCAGARVGQVLGEELLPEVRPPVLYFAKGIGCTITGAGPLPHAIRTPNRSEACGLHIAPRARGRVYMGASNHYGWAPAAARGITPGELTAILGYCHRELNQHLRDCTVESLRFGLRPMTADDQPLLGRTRLPGLHLATGTRRTGIVMAPVISEVVSAGVLGRESEVHHPFGLHPGREGLGNGDGIADLNIVMLHADRGLRAWTRARLEQDPSHLREARTHWLRYREQAGSLADPQILELLDSIEQGDTTSTHPGVC